MSVYTAIVPKIRKIVARKLFLEKTYQQSEICDTLNLSIPQIG